MSYSIALSLSYSIVLSRSIEVSSISRSRPFYSLVRFRGRSSSLRLRRRELTADDISSYNTFSSIIKEQD